MNKKDGYIMGTGKGEKTRMMCGTDRKFFLTMLALGLVGTLLTVLILIILSLFYDF
jgi:hypothetical protein